MSPGRITVTLPVNHVSASFSDSALSGPYSVPAVVRGQPPVFIHPWLPVVGVHGYRGDEDVLAHGPVQDRCGITYPLRHRRRIVDAHVPRAALEGIQLTVPVALQMLDLGRQVCLPSPPVEYRHLVSPRDCVEHLMRTDEASTTEDQEPERPGRFALTLSHSQHHARGRRTEADRAQHAGRHLENVTTRSGHDTTPKRLVACNHTRPLRRDTAERTNTDDINLTTSTNTIRPRLTSVRRVDSPDPGLQPIASGWHRDACQLTAIDLSQRRSTEGDDGNHAEGETRQREHEPGAPPVHETAGDEVADAHHPARRPPIQCHHPTAD